MLTLRRLNVMIQYLPIDAACSILLNDDRLPWTRTEHLLDELRQTVEASAGKKNPKPHPDRNAKGSTQSPERLRKIARARARAHDRKRKIEAGLIT